MKLKLVLLALPLAFSSLFSMVEFGQDNQTLRWENFHIYSTSDDFGTNSLAGDNPYLHRSIPTTVQLKMEDYIYLLQTAIHPDQRTEKLYISGIATWYSFWKSNETYYNNNPFHGNIYGPEGTNRIIAKEFPRIPSVEKDFYEYEPFFWTGRWWYPIWGTPGYELHSDLSFGENLGGRALHMELPYIGNISGHKIESTFEGYMSSKRGHAELQLGINDMYTDPYRWIGSATNYVGHKAAANVTEHNYTFGGANHVVNFFNVTHNDNGIIPHDPVRVLLPDGMVWDQTWELKEMFAKHQIGGALQFLEPSAHGSNWFVSPWMGLIYDHTPDGAANWIFFPDAGNDYWYVYPTNLKNRFWKYNNIHVEIPDYYSHVLSKPEYWPAGSPHYTVETITYSQYGGTHAGERVTTNHHIVPSDGYFFFSQNENSNVWMNPATYPYYFVRNTETWKRVGTLPQAPEAILPRWIAVIRDLPLLSTQWNEQSPSELPKTYREINGVQGIVLDHSWLEHEWFGRFKNLENSGWVEHELITKALNSNIFLCPNDTTHGGIFFVGSGEKLYWTNKQSFPDVWSYSENKWINTKPLPTPPDVSKYGM